MAADHLQQEISNGVLRVGLYPPNVQNGYYRGTRFDWSGLIHRLQYKGHEYYGPWYDKMDSGVRDFVYRDGAIVAGACSWATGPAEEFDEIGYDAALTDKACIELARAHFGWGGASNQECVTCALTAQLRRETGHPAQGENPVTGRARQTPNLTDPR